MLKDPLLSPHFASHYLLDLDAEVEAAFAIGHFEVLAVAAGAAGHRI